MKHWIKRKLWQIRNIFRWLPIIWSQYDFDYDYAVKVFNFQLQKTAEYLESDKANTVDAKVNAQKIRTFLKLHKKIQDCDYSCEYQDKVDQKYGKGVRDFHFEPLEDQPGYSRLLRKYDNLPNSKEIKEYSDKMFKESQLKEKKAKRIMWSFLKFNLERWWD